MGLVVHNRNVAWDEAYFRTTWHLDASSRLTTIDMGRKLGVPVHFLGEMLPHATQRGLGRDLPSTKWHLDPSIRLATIEMGENWGAVALWGELGPHLTQCRLGRGLRPYQVASPAVWPQQTWAEKWGVLCPFFGGAGSTSNRVPGPRPTPVPSGTGIVIHPAVWHNTWAEK